MTSPSYRFWPLFSAIGALSLFTAAGAQAADPVARASFALVPEERAVARFHEPALPPPSRAETPGAAYAHSYSPAGAPSWSRSASAPAYEPPMADRAAPEQAPPDGSWRDDWVLSVEGVTHAPVDAGIRIGLQVPAGLRVSGGYGWVPSRYLGFLTSLASMAAAGDEGSGAVLDHGYQQGKTWRAQIGIRPFRNTGVYLDAGYSEVRLSGGLELAEVGGFSAGAAPMQVQTTLRMWLVELGYQTDIASRIVLGIGIGAMGTVDSKTELSLPSSASAEQGASANGSARDLDEQLERYGILPTLTLRLGFDLI